MNLKIKEIADLTGVTVRTLHYYDEISLLKPGVVTETGYRLYNEDNLELLQQILFFRELDFPLIEIKEIVTSPLFDKTKALQKHRELLLKKRERLDNLINLTEKTLKGESTMSFKEFDMTEIEESMKEYAEEVQERWGNTQAYAQSRKRTSSYNKEQWAQIDAEVKGIFRTFADLSSQGLSPGSEQAQAAVKSWQNCISSHFYTCSDEMLASLGMMYTGDERFRKNLDGFGDGTAQFMSKSIEIYCTGR